MADALFGTDDLADADTERATQPKANWPLMGDILAHRAGVPEHLIQWRRAMGEDDPAPDVPVTLPR